MALSDARCAALAMVARREYTQALLTEKLLGKGFSSEDVKVVVDDLLADNYINDARFAEMFVREAKRLGRGPLRIERDLQQKGIQKDVLQECLQADEQVWLELARQTRARRFGDSIPEKYALKAKQMRYLQRQGFHNWQIQQAFNVRDLGD